jgi:hypothetical protein
MRKKWETCDKKNCRYGEVDGKSKLIVIVIVIMHICWWESF